MTWSAFFQAMRKGLATRATSLSRRKASPSTTSGTKPVATQAKQATPRFVENSTLEQWDYVLMSAVFTT